MSLCPWCKSNIDSSHSLCPVCGKDPSDHPSVAGAGFSTLDAFDDDAPSVGLALAPDSVGRAAQPQVGYSGDRFNDGFDDMDDGGGEDGIKLELAPTPKPETALAPEAPAAPPPPPPAPKLPDHAPSLDPIEIALLADFGPAPRAIWMCPAYSLRVLRRKREIGRMLRAAQKGAADAEAVRDDKLAAIAERLRPSLDADRELAGYLAPLARAEQSATDRERALSDRSAQYAALVAGIDQKIATQETSASAVAERLRAASVDEETKSQLLSRAQAALKRAEIELRNAEDLARAAAGPEAKEATPEHAQAVIQARRSVELRRQELASPKTEAEASRRVLRAVQAESDEIERHIKTLRAERSRAETTFSRELGVRSEGLELARTERRAALISIGARLFDTNSELIPKPEYEAFHRLRSDVVARHLDVERAMRAMASADAAAVKRGWIVIGAAAALLLIVIALSVSAIPG